MNKQIIFILLLSTLNVAGQNSSNDSLKTYFGKKGLYQIKYKTEKWHEEKNRTKWDIEFGDKYDLLSAFYIEYDYFISEKHLKSQTKLQFAEYGKIKKFKTYKKLINNLIVNYFEFELNYDTNICRYEGFCYNGNGGTVELMFSGQLESIEKNKNTIEEFSNGFSLVN
jgi:hypothetical protein